MFPKINNQQKLYHRFVHGIKTKITTIIIVNISVSNSK